MASMRALGGALMACLWVFIWERLHESRSREVRDLRSRAANLRTSSWSRDIQAQLFKGKKNPRVCEDFGTIFIKVGT